MNYKGDLKGFPQEVVEKMLERQVGQGNKKDVSVFERCNGEDYNCGGFDWHRTIEGDDFWDEVIEYQDFNVFFKRYPKKEYPRVMLVSNNEVIWQTRVVFMEKKGVYIAWASAETIEEAEESTNPIPWTYAKEIEKSRQSKSPLR